ncbi:reverse transcriptase domain-containing protein [Wolbachia endosymbiont of Psylliodes chrysocephala]|uniref:reverse transcriptase domain-containing protein n=1 Tax=Wolbachia endosymbiont of Psylliodes chrysocephala TaxID=2883236 RepID=UPI0020A0133A|nr:reverse transcriptase domain-containing protein [Wolbachia endosymbiont of Psylliodes chrysocephala]
MVGHRKENHCATTKRHSRSRDRQNRNAIRHRSRSPISRRSERISRSPEIRSRIQRRSPVDTDSGTEARLGLLERLVDRLSRTSSLSREQRDPPARSNIKSDCIPMFEPGNADNSSEKWISKIEQLKALNGWDEKTTIYNMQSRLGGLARSWYNGLNSYNLTWAEWKSLITTTFPSHHDYASQLRKMLQRTKMSLESWDKYYFEKMELVRACEIFGKKAVSCTIDGITEQNIKTGAKAGRYSTPESLYSEFLSTLPTTSYSNQSERRQLHQNSRIEKPSMKKSISQNNTNTSLKCYNCKGEGHPYFKCPKPKIKCSMCKLMGHSAENCKNKPKTILKCSNVMDNSGCYFLDCKVNGVMMKAFVDTGCSVVVIREEDAKNIGLRWTSASVTLKGYNNSISKSIGKTVVHLVVDQASDEVEVLIVPSHVQQIPVIIGQSFINGKNKLMIVKDNVVHISDKEDTLILPNLEYTRSPTIKLFPKEETEIPPNTMMNIEVTCEDYNGDIYVEYALRTQPELEYCIGRCITTSVRPIIPIINMSNSDIILSKDSLIARGQECSTELSEEMEFVNTVSIDPITIKLEDIQVDKSVKSHQKVALLDLLNKYVDCFANTTAEIGKCATELDIILEDEKPVTYKPYKLSISERTEVRNIIDDLLTNEIIRESDSPYASPILLVKKKTGEYRMCVDYRALNAKTVKDKYPLPRVDEHLERLKGCNYFTSLDLSSGYHQIPMAAASISKTAFVTPDGHYEYLRMPFGLANAPACFQRMINKILGPLRFTTAMAYMDDILIPTKDIKSGLESLELILRVLREAKLTLRLTKCQFFKSEIEYLGHEISSDGTKPGKRKTDAIERFPTPKNVHEVRQFIGLSSYFRKYIQSFSLIAKPLTQLTKKGILFVWEKPQQDAFETLKQKLISRPLLALYDSKAWTELHTDACKLGIGGILLQRQEDESLRPVLYFSRQTTKEEQRYHSYELETLAVVVSMRQFRVYLIGIQFKVVTDCNAVRSTLTKRDLIPRIGRWWLTTQEYNFTIEYRPGTKMSHADALSRNAVSCPDDFEHSFVFLININDDDWVLAAQLQDERCQHIYEVLCRTPTDQEEKKLHADFVLKNGRIYRKEGQVLRWLVPKQARHQLVTAYHDQIGHFGYEKTISSLSKLYWFAGMTKYIKNYVKGCLRCLYNKESSRKAGFQYPIEKKECPMDTIHIDHLGPFVKSKHKNTHLILAVDSFTKFVFLKPVPNTKTEPVIKFLSEIFDNFGVPRRIISDRGTCYTSSKYLEYCKSLGVKTVHNATATPRANGQAERYNRTILAAITASTDDEEKWDQIVPKIRWGLNTTVNKATGYSAYKLLLGYEPRSTFDSFLSNEISPDTTPCQSDIEKLRADASQHIIKEQISQKQRFDKTRIKVPDYKVGQLVLVRKEYTSNYGKSKKLLPKYDGPYTITAVLDFDRFVIEDMKGSTRSQKRYKGVCAPDRMKPYIMRAEYDDYEDVSQDSMAD